MRNILATAAAFIGLALSVGTPADAYDWQIVAHVTSVEVTTSPAMIDFRADQAGGSCAAGSLLFWLPPHHATDATSQAQNASSALSALMTADVTGHTVTLYGSNAGCEINFLYLN